MLKIVSQIAISMIFLISTTGLTINLHYCQDKLYDIGIYSKADNCCDDGHHHHNCCEKESKSNNCEDKTIQVKVKDDFTDSSFNFELQSFHFLNIFLHNSLLFVFSNSQKDADEIIPYIDTSPLDPLKKLSLLQTFLL